jgi:hypothetical protein
MRPCESIVRAERRWYCLTMNVPLPKFCKEVYYEKGHLYVVAACLLIIFLLHRCERRG